MIIVILIISIVVAVLFYRNTLPEISNNKKIILISMRSVFIFLLLLFLFNPILHLNKTEAIKPVFLFLRDNSKSMSQIIDSKTKSDYLKTLEESLIKAVKKQGYDVEIKEIFKENPKQSLITNEINSIDKLNNQLYGIVLSSDGWFHDNSAMFKEILDIPIYSFNPELQNKNIQLKINELIYNKNSMPDEIQPLIVKLETQNYTGSIKAILKDQDNKVLQSKDLMLSEDENNKQVEFELIFKDLGLNIFKVEVEIVDKSITASDFGAIQVIEKKNKILIVTDELNWNVRFLNRIINDENRFESDLIYQKETSFYQKNKIVSLDASQYSGFIFINNGNLNFNQNTLEMIKNKVFNATGVITIGQVIKGLEEISPVTTSNIGLLGEGQTRLKPEALSYQIFRDYELQWTKHSPVNFLFHKIKDQAVMLAEVVPLGMQIPNQNIPAISLNIYGSANVIHFSFTNLWTWLSEPQTRFFNDWLKNILLWVFAHSSEHFYANTNKNIYYQGEPVSINLFAYDEQLNPLRNLNAKIDIHNKQNEVVYSDFFTTENRNSSNEAFNMTFDNLEPNEYSYEIYDNLNNKQSKGEFSILDVDVESRNIGFNTNLLNNLSSSSGGDTFTEESIKNFNIPTAKKIKTNKQIEIPIYKNIFAILIFLISFCSELYLRKKWSLL
ncbi:MAG: hypothetical protein PHY08_05265 [Candidatus Cloacimonetes bacterium]|nr:hypothetical protein [Candidatus Cloacimonadota bacterium]